MAKRIITISREIAEQSGFSPEYIQENAELSPKKGLFAYAFSGRDITGRSIEDMVYEAQRKVILGIAEKMITDTDKRCRTNYNFYTEQKWGMAGNYTLSLNSSVLGYDMCQKVIMDCTKI